MVEVGARMVYLGWNAVVFVLCSLLGLQGRGSLARSFEADALPGWLGEVHSISKSPKSIPPRFPVTSLSWRPRVLLYESFLSSDECSHIINLATPSMSRTTVVDPVTGKLAYNNYRSSYGTFIKRGEDPVIRGIEERISQWTFLPVANQEDIQILRYTKGQKYDPHHDFFDERDAAYMKGGHRLATIVLYLSIPEFGGETVFTSVGQANLSIRTDPTWSNCGKEGLGVKPVKGNALLFYSMHPNGTTDALSLHRGCPVVKGEKWIATKWIHVGPWERMSPPSNTPQPPRHKGSDALPCVDGNALCKTWADKGECERNSVFMSNNCRKTCKKCDVVLNFSK